MDNKKQIDDLFRDKLGNFQPEFVPEHWQMMKSAMANPRNIGFKNTRNNISSIIMLITAIFLVTTGIVAYVALERSRQAAIKGSQLASTTVTADKNAAQDVYIDNPSASNADNKLDEPVVSNQHDRTNNVSENTIKQSDNNNSGQGAFVKPNVTKIKDNDVGEPTKKTVVVNGNPVTKTSVNNVPIEKASEINNGINNGTKNEGFINGVNVDYKVMNSEEDVAITDKTELSDKEKFNSAYSESELNVPVSDESPDYSSVVDDYNANKSKAKELKKQKSKNANQAKNKNLEALPDYKVGVMNNIAINPAYTGFNQRHTITVSTMVFKPLYRPGNDFNVPFEYSFAYDFNFGKRKNCGIGIDYKRFIGAAKGMMAVDLTFAYRFNLAQYHNLRVGASLSYYSTGINKDNLSFPDMIDSGHGFVYGTSEAFPGKTSKNNLDVGLGLWYSWKSLYVGVSAIHLTSPDIGILGSSNVPREYVLSAGYNYVMNERFSMLPLAELKYNEKTFNFSPGMLFTYNRWLLFGTEFRNLKDAGLVLGFNLKDNVIINIRSGIPMNKILINNFGVIDYAGVNVRLQF